MIFRHIKGVSVKAIFSPCGKFRYKLTIKNTVGSGSKTVCAVMQNPSVANSDRADKSAKFLETVIFQKDYEEFKSVKHLVVVNQFAYIQTKNFKGSEKQVGSKNDNSIREAVNSADIVLIAWGKSNKFGARKQVVNSIISKSSKKVLLQTIAHPSRCTYIDCIKPYSI